MLLERLIDSAGKEPEFDWDAYYQWLFSKHAGRPVTSFAFWECTKCLTINILYLPTRYGKCRCCSLLHIPTS